MKNLKISDYEINKLAEDYVSSLPETCTWNEYDDDGENIHSLCSACEIEKAFKAGYILALNNIIFKKCPKNSSYWTKK